MKRNLGAVILIVFFSLCFVLPNSGEIVGTGSWSGIYQRNVCTIFVQLDPLGHRWRRFNLPNFFVVCREDLWIISEQVIVFILTTDRY